nr:very short patch repair endonuclease [Lentzea atacamensis]
MGSDNSGKPQVVYRHVDPGPAPPASSETTSRVMRRTRRTGTAPELAVRRALHRRGLRYLVDVAPPGTNRRRRVDVLLRGAKIALFVDGCFWHSCPEHGQVPKANREWWEVKLHGVVVRDRDTDLQLAAAGWLVVRVWEHDDPEQVADRVVALVAAGVRPPRA